MYLPKSLYKYELFSAQALANLKASRIYFGSPQGFNDPYDCATRPVVLRPSANEVELIRESYLSERDVPESVKAGLASASVEKLQDLIHRAGVSTIESAVQQFLTERGVSCFSGKNEDLLMWSHYAGKYKGFCLEFSTIQMPFSNAKRVSYHEKIPDTSVVPFLLPQRDDPVVDFFCIKSKSWSYEQEWRVIHEKAGPLYHYEPEALTGVYFGPETSIESLEIICLILRGQNKGVKFWRGLRSKTEFQIEFEEFNYHSHLEAKKLGLI